MPRNDRPLRNSLYHDFEIPQIKSIHHSFARDESEHANSALYHLYKTALAETSNYKYLRRGKVPNLSIKMQSQQCICSQVPEKLYPVEFMDPFTTRTKKMQKYNEHCLHELLFICYMQCSPYFMKNV